MDEQPNMIKRVIGHKQIEFVEKTGAINLMGINGILMPVVTFAYLHKLLREKVGTNTADSLFYYVGENQGRQAVDLLVKKFGYSNEPVKVINSILAQQPMMGFGKSTLTRIDVENKHIIISNYSSPVADMYKGLFGHDKTPIDIYWRSILGGAASELFDKDMICVEKECIVMGKSKCVFEIRERKELEKTDELTKSQLPNIDLRPTEIELKKWFSKH